jgi:hypothetical protein
LIDPKLLSEKSVDELLKSTDERITNSRVISRLRDTFDNFNRNQVELLRNKSLRTIILELERIINETNIQSKKVNLFTQQNNMIDLASRQEKKNIQFVLSLDAQKAIFRASDIVVQSEQSREKVDIYTSDDSSGFTFQKTYGEGIKDEFERSERHFQYNPLSKYYILKHHKAFYIATKYDDESGKMVASNFPVKGLEQYNLYLNPEELNANYEGKGSNRTEKQMAVYYDKLLYAGLDHIVDLLTTTRGVLLTQIGFSNGQMKGRKLDNIKNNIGITAFTKDDDKEKIRAKMRLAIKQMIDEIDDKDKEFDPNFMFLSVVVITENFEGN